MLRFNTPECSRNVSRQESAPMSSVSQRRPLRRLLTLFALLGLLVPMLAAYNPPSALADTVSVTANVHLCPYDLTGLDVYTIAPLCTSQAIGDIVTLDNGSGVVLTLNTDGSGLATFSNVDAGISTFYLYAGAVPPYNGVVAGCKQEDGTGTDLVPYALMPIGGLGDVNFFFAAGAASEYCDFFLFQPGVTPPAPTTYGTVTLNKITCPDGFDGYSADIYGLAQNCQDVSKVVSFSLTDSTGATSNATTPGSGVNLATFANVPSGALTIVETPVPDYGLPRVFCKNSKITGEEDPEDEVGVTDTTVNVELKNGYDDLYCDWFNISYTEPKIDITVTKHKCTDGYSGTDLNDLYANCTEPFDPLSFKLDGASSGNPGEQTTGDVIPGGVQWTQMDPDTWYIQEMVSTTDFGLPIVYCKLTAQADGSVSTDDQIPVETRDDGYRISYQVDAGYNLSCDWFNLKSSPYVGIYIHKYGCPANWQQNWTLNDYYQYCQTIVQGAVFHASGSGGDNSQPLSGIDLAWENMAPGDYVVGESQPSGWSGSVVYCSVGTYNGSQADYSQMNLSDSLEFPVTLTDNQYIDCYWYNLLKQQPVSQATVDPNAPATLTIVKYTCDESYDPLAIGANPETDCSDTTDHITFTVLGSSNASVKGKTGDDGDGTVTFSGLKPGSYLLRESYPDLVENAFIWTCDSDYRVFNYPFAPFARIDASGTTKISLIAGETLTCAWYDVPSPKPEVTPDADTTSPTGGEVDVNFTVLQCASGQIPSSACDPADEGTGVSLTSSDGAGGPIDFETDADGKANGSVDEGVYDLDADSSVCFAESDAMSDDGTLDLTSGDPADVTVYLCS
jgi:hypothetical protein